MNVRRIKYKNRYGMLYFKVTEGGWGSPDKWGSTNTLERACGWCSFHIGCSDVNKDESKKAAIYDRHIGAIIKTYTRTANGITIKEH